MFNNIIGPDRDMTLILRFWPVLVFSFISALVVTYLCRKIAVKYGIIDQPDNLVKTHKEPIAYLGGIGILAGLTAGILLGIYRLQVHRYLITIELLGILTGGAIACFVGVIDDILDLKPWQKILGQTTAALILIMVGIVPDLRNLAGPLGISMSPGTHMLLGILFVIIFVLGATNSLNLLDGLDGLCGGVTAIITVAMLLLTVHLMTWDFSEVNDRVRLITCMGLVGGVCGFLPFNRYPAKIFMGDAGSMLLGFITATLMILFAEKAIKWLMASVVVFGLPVLDTTVAIVRRLINKRPLFVSDRGHIYDQMIDRGIPLKKTVAICYILAGTYAAIGLVMSQIKTRYAVVAYIFVFVISGLVVWKKGYLKMEGLRGAIHR